MSARRIKATNRTALYIIAVVVIVVAFLLLGGGAWMRSMGTMHGGRSLGMASWNWVQILISLAIGFLLGIVVSRRT